ncbi:MAG: hypothetical protein Q9207_004473 [Kuettlingeria erythrocarpa]
MDTKRKKNLADPVLLETIDKLFEYNIGEYVDLPQLLVVGDQSSGKSSVLAGLTDLPFPRDSGLCTRFATQITFRRSPSSKIAVSIIPPANATQEHSDKIRAWKKDNLTSFKGQILVDVLREVSGLMGIGDTSASGKRTFSDDVLKIEICGPEQEHLSVVDVPGIFKKTTKGVTTSADIELVQSMVGNYMRNPRSAILAVIPANVDIATQEILEMADMHDSKGVRTLGVLTKPDLVDKGAEQSVVDLVEGKRDKLGLGWSVVRNPGQQQIKEEATVDRHESEKLFFTTAEPWNKLDKDRVGIEALQRRLKEILTEMVRREFPNVKADINKRLSACQGSLGKLGPSRETTEQQQKYLLDLASRFQRLTSWALEARYGSDDVFETRPALRLATDIVNRNAVFSDDVRQRGHTINFSGDSDQEPEGAANIIAVWRDKLIVTKTPSVRYIKNASDIDELMHEGKKVVAPAETDILAWLRSVYDSCRGFELGSFDASLLPMVWKKQSAHWDNLALGYISDIVALVHDFIVNLLHEVCEDEHIRIGVYNAITDQLAERYKKAIDHAKFILHVERSGTPLTTNHYFADNLEKSRTKRMRDSLKTQTIEISGYGAMVQVDSMIQGSTGSNTEHTIQDLHDILRSYYKVARKRFVDVLCMQAADYHLVKGPDAPARVFTPAFVSGLTAEQLEQIAGEEMVSKKKREGLMREIGNLQNGKKILK